MEFLEDYSFLDNIPYIEPKPTFLEIAGFPHYENVISNILAFFLKKSSLHNINELLLQSLVEEVEKKIEPKETSIKNTIYTEVKREVWIGEGRIDILIVNKDTIIAIENKIWHTLENNLNDYSTYLDSRYTQKNKIKIILSLYPSSKEENHGFINILYKDLIKTLQEKTFCPSNEYSIYFQHLIKTIQNLYGMVDITQDEIDFLINYRDKINTLLALDQKFDRYLSQRISEISSQIIRPEHIEVSIYQYLDIVLVYKSVDTTYKLECYVSKESGFWITICVETNHVDIEKLNKLQFFKKNNNISVFEIIEVDKNSTRLILYNFPLQTDNQEIINKLNEILLLYKID